MIDHYFLKTKTLDRIRASWLGKPIEQYVAWLTERGYVPRNVYRRVPLLMQFARNGKLSFPQGTLRSIDLDAAQINAALDAVEKSSDHIRTVIVATTDH